MFRKKALMLLALAVMLALPALVLAQGARTYAVLPFKVTGDKYQYMSRGAQTMLSSRLAWLGYFEPAPAANVERAGTRLPASASEAQSLMGQVGSDFLVAGAIVFNDKQADLEIKVYDRKGQTWTKTSQAPIEGLVPALEKLATEVRGEVFKRPGDDKAAAEKEKKELRKEQQNAAPVPRNAEFLSGGATEAAVGPAGGPVMNPQFRYEGGSETPGRWQSQSLRFQSVGMVVADFDGNKKNSVVIAGENQIYSYDFYQNTLRPLSSIKVSMRFRILRLSTFDLDRDGRAELLVSGVDDPDGNMDPRTYIYRVNGGKFEEFMPYQRSHMAVVRTPPTYVPTLLSQDKGSHGPFDERGVSEVIYSGGKELQTVRHLKLPSIANVYNFTYLPDQTSHKILVLNEYNYLKTFTPDGEVQASMEEGYNSSAIYVVIDERMPGMNTGKRDDATALFYYIPIRMIPVSFDPRGKYEVIMNKDISVAAQVFQRFRRFSQGEVHSLFWDGVGMSLAWKSRRIKGTVVDLAVDDLQNTGKKQLVVCLNTYSGAVGSGNEKTVVVTYDLDASPQK